MPKSKWLRHFMSYFKTFALKQALCSVFCNPCSLRSLLGIKKGAFSPFFVILRRVRDSNPRTCYSQQFSRLPQSTALPTLRGKCRKGNRILQKYLQFIWLNNWSNLLTTMYLYKNGLSERIICIKCVFLEI